MRGTANRVNSQTLLGGDAFSRGKITEAEYRKIQTSAANDLKGVINPLNHNNFMGGNPMKDETFNREFQSLLNPTKAEIYRAAVDAALARPEKKDNPRDICNLPTMELEKLDATVLSAKKLSGGMKTMIEGADELKGLDPHKEE